MLNITYEFYFLLNNSIKKDGIIWAGLSLKKSLESKVHLKIVLSRPTELNGL